LPVAKSWGEIDLAASVAFGRGDFAPDGGLDAGLDAADVEAAVLVGEVGLGSLSTFRLSRESLLRARSNFDEVKLRRGSAWMWVGDNSSAELVDGLRMELDAQRHLLAEWRS